MVDILLDRKVGGVVSYFHCVIFLLLDRLALIHYTRFRSTIPWHGRPWVEHGVTTECSTIRVIVRALTSSIRAKIVLKFQDKLDRQLVIDLATMSSLVVDSFLMNLPAPKIGKNKYFSPGRLLVQIKVCNNNPYF